MKNKFKNVGLNKVTEIVSAILDENNTKSINVTSKLILVFESNKYHWVFLNENQLEEFELEFIEVIFFNLKTLLLYSGVIGSL